MRKTILVSFLLILALSTAFAQGQESVKSKFILLIAEQNIEGPQKCWWASEIDLSTTESAVAQKLLTQGFEVLEPSVLNKTIAQDSAFRVVNLNEQNSVKIGKLSAADYVIVGKALATSGGNVPQSSMRSCFANITAKLIRVKDGKVIAYVDASGNSAHLDVITGGKEALNSAGQDLATKIIDALNKEGESK
jgi:hypothetical protein